MSLCLLMHTCMPCMHEGTYAYACVYRLIRVAGFWYYTLSIVVGHSAYIAIYGPRFWVVNNAEDGVAVSAFAVEALTSIFCYVFGLAALDSAPPHLVSMRARIGVAGLMAIYKSVLLRLHHRKLHGSSRISRRGLTRRTLARSYHLISHKLGIAEVYSSGNVPEWQVDGFVESSSFDAMCKAEFVISVLLLHAVYRMWRCTCTHARTHARMHALTHSRTRSRTCTRTHACTHAHMHISKNRKRSCRERVCVPE